MAIENVQSCIDVLIAWGFCVKIGKTIGNKAINYFSGTDAERLQDFQFFLDDKSVKAIICARGGYGISRIIDQIDFSTFVQNPKWIVGFSDVTILHAHIHKNFSITTLHAPMAAAFNKEEYKNEYVQSLRKSLIGEPIEYRVSAHAFNRRGTVRAVVVGGNLTLLTHLIGTASDIDTSNTILMLEDIGEYLYNIDRMLQQLKRSGKLSKLAGLIIGEFSDCKDTSLPFGKSVYEIIKEAISEFSFPVCFGFPVGHNKNNYALKIGEVYELNIDEHVVLREKSL